MVKVNETWVATKESDDDDAHSIDTDDMSSESDTDIKATVERLRSQQLAVQREKEIELQKKYAEYKTDKIESDDEGNSESKPTNGDGKSKRKTKYANFYTYLWLVKSDTDLVWKKNEKSNTLR